MYTSTHTHIFFHTNVHYRWLVCFNEAAHVLFYTLVLDSNQLYKYTELILCFALTLYDQTAFYCSHFPLACTYTNVCVSLCWILFANCAQNSLNSHFSSVSCIKSPPEISFMRQLFENVMLTMALVNWLRCRFEIRQI